MTQKQFDLGMKRFFRCMKENGYYWFVTIYLLPPGRTKKDLLNDINDKHYDTNFAMLLGYLNLLGPSYDRLGNQHWVDTIKKPYELWRRCCYDKYPEYLHRI